MSLRPGFCWCGRCRIRTYVGISRRIYSPLPLAARAICRACTIGAKIPCPRNRFRCGEKNTTNAPPFCKPGGYGRCRPDNVEVSPIRNVGRTRCSNDWKECEVADSSFDVVSKVDRQEVDNALHQAAKELATRFDFRNTGASHRVVRRRDDHRDHADTEERRQGRARRVQGEADPPRHLAEGVRRRRAGAVRQDLQDHRHAGPGHQPARTRRRSPKKIRDEGPKGVKAQIQGEELRVSSKKRDDLQAVISCSRVRTSASPCSSSTTGRGAAPLCAVVAVLGLT